LDRMVDLLKRLMEANRTTGNQITTGDTRPGRTSWVAARTGKPCRRCATPIRKAAQPSYDGDRVTYWCPTCQPGPGPSRATRV
jgi:endonuclease-8